MVFLDYAVLVGYFLLMALIGLICMLRVRVQEDYFLGGRGFGKLLQTFAAFGAGTGSSDPVNTGRTTFTSGMSGMWSVMYWLFVTPFYWITAVWYRRMRHTTLGDWFTERYESRLLGAAYALFGMLFMITYGSMMFSAIGKVAAPLVGNSGSFLGIELDDIEYVLVPIIGLIVLIYGTAGGLRAAYWTDLVQGFCIILLSVLLIPGGLSALVERFGNPNEMGRLDGFRILHEQIPQEFFSILGSGNKSEFPWHFLVAVVIINIITVVIQPHFIITGGGSAKNENSARIGLVTGNFLKRFCTLGWVLTALIALALYADSPELAGDPDKTWGVASRELLGPGFTGLMLACLLAALMSSIDVYMIVGSALMVRNIYVPFFAPEASEQKCLRIARLTGILVVGGSVMLSLAMMDVFAQLQLTWVVLVPVAAPFWIGMYWRRATTTAAWTTVVFCALMFFVLPWLTPWMFPGLRTNSYLTKVTPRIETTVTRPAAPTDVSRRQAAIQLWEQSSLQGISQDTLGPRPEPLQIGGNLSETSVSGGIPIYWSEAVLPIDAQGRPVPNRLPSVVETRTLEQGRVTQRVRKYTDATALMGQGQLQLDYLFYSLLGLPLEEYSAASLRTLDLPLKILVPFLVMILASLVTRPNSEESLDRYYVKMKTPVTGDNEFDAQQLDESFEFPHRFDHRKLFRNSQLEIQRPTLADVVGFLVCVGACFAIIYLAVLIASLGVN